MFDYCRNKLDLNNIDHLACTEIRAANQCHCSFFGAWYRGTASPFHIKKAHQVSIVHILYILYKIFPFMQIKYVNPILHYRIYYNHIIQLLL